MAVFSSNGLGGLEDISLARYLRDAEAGVLGGIADKNGGDRACFSTGGKSRMLYLYASYGSSLPASGEPALLLVVGGIVI